MKTSLVLVALLVAASCVPGTTQIVEVTAPPGMDSPVRVVPWESVRPAGILHLNGGEAAVMAWFLTDAQTALAYVATTSVSQTDAWIIIDNNGSTLDFLDTQAQVNVQGLEFGILRFGPRVAGGSELWFGVGDRSDANRESSILVARRAGDEPDYQDTRIFGYSMDIGASLDLGGGSVSRCGTTDQAYTGTGVVASILVLGVGRGGGDEHCAVVIWELTDGSFESHALSQ
ncbi:MAG TPA: hypothetical protein PLC98_24760 [Anaerolineales bacterium]|nr:hypothetical protein [Anaerolineales bacterium]